VSSAQQVRTTLTPDGTLGTTVTSHGTVHTIAGGTRPGNGPNLFHSFERFSVGTGETADFMGPAGIVNILSRVTGGQRSEIDGTLRSTTPGVHLYLLNPSGVMFGPNATLDVRGSFHVSTADYLRLADGARFFTRLSEQSTLSIAPPMAFGFLGPPPAPITVTGTTLTVPRGETFSLVGGAITIAGNPERSAMGVPTLSAFGGRIHLESMGAAGEVVPPPPGQPLNLEMGSVARAGTIRLEGARIDVSTQNPGTGPAGRVTVVAREVRLEGANTRILARTNNSGDGGEIAIHADTLTLRSLARGGAHIDVSAQNPGTGHGGRVTVVARDVRLEGEQTRIAATPSDRGAGGEIAIHADTLTLLGDQSQIDVSSIVNSANSQGTGPAGRVRVVVREVRLEGGRILAGTFNRGAGGEIDVQADRLTLTRNAEINASTESRGGGRGGRVRVVGREVRLEDVARIWTRAEVGDGGELEVRAGTLTLSQEAQIGAVALGTGRGGHTTVIASEAIVIAGQGKEPARISSDARGDGAGGDVVVEAPTVLLDNGQILSSTIGGRGRGGAIAVQAKHLELRNGGIIGADSKARSDGPAGTIRIQAEKTFRSEHGQVTTASDHAGGGTIELQAGSLVHLSASELTTSVRGGGADAGNLVINSLFTILEGSHISANAFGGQGGNIQIRAQQAFLADPASQVSAEALSKLGINGQVNIQAPVTSLSGAVAPLSLVFASAATLLRSPCAARLHAGTVSTLIERGRPGMPATPDGVLPSRLPPASLDTAASTQARGLPSVAFVSPLEGSPRTPNRVLPLQGWAAPADSLRLLSECAAR
jgi:filamentous hemagglutinin family protein